MLSGKLRKGEAMKQDSFSKRMKDKLSRQMSNRVEEKFRPPGSSLIDLTPLKQLWSGLTTFLAFALLMTMMLAGAVVIGLFFMLLDAAKLPRPPDASDSETEERLKNPPKKIMFRPKRNR
jgi:hypothetical protein